MFININNLIDDTQIGFKKNCRTSDHMFILRALIDKHVKKLKSPLYVFVFFVCFFCCCCCCCFCFLFFFVLFCFFILEKHTTVFGDRL